MTIGIIPLFVRESINGIDMFGGSTVPSQNTLWLYLASGGT